MKSLAWIAAVLLASTACEKQPSKLDQIAPPGGMPQGDLEARVARLEKNLAAREEALAFLDMAYEQQVEQQTKPQPGTVYGVDIAQNLAVGMVEGPQDALVTIVEAWDYA
jgi:hypothetical protein